MHTRTHARTHTHTHTHAHTHTHTFHVAVLQAHCMQVVHALQDTAEDVPHIGHNHIRPLIRVHRVVQRLKALGPHLPLYST